MATVQFPYALQKLESLQQRVDQLDLSTRDRLLSLISKCKELWQILMARAEEIEKFKTQGYDVPVFNLKISKSANYFAAELEKNKKELMQLIGTVESEIIIAEHPLIESKN